MFSTIASAPAKQSVGETIAVYSGRLNSATLLEDRRNAILGLRSFAKDYPASVASGALRSLIGSLSNDGEDVDTVKIVLETLLMLFNPNQESPEASEEIALWLADEFTQRQENVTLLLDFLETNDFYSRLYSLQLLSAILSARTERTEECVIVAPLGIPRLVAVLDDRREAVRNEAVSLLTYLTPISPEVQKVVAFQNAFERIFTIIDIEGGLPDGDRIVEDCLILLANLLRLNASNQAIFREEGHVPKLSKLLKGTYELGKEAEEVAQWAQQQGNRNIYALLAVLRLFLVPGDVGTFQNQAAFWQHGVLYHTLQLAFSQAVDVPIRAEALTTCADIIRDNPKLQESFAQLQVPSVIPVDTNGLNGKTNGISVTLVYVIDALLDLTLSVVSVQIFDVRMAACECLKAYFHNHREIRLHFLHRAIEGHNSGQDETANVLTTLLQPSATSPANASDPYRHWFASVILMHLLSEQDEKDDEAKKLAMGVTEGDAESGEEVVTSIQTITAHLLSGLRAVVDDRIIVGYLMLLSSWLWWNPDGVNDFLSEGSNVQALASIVKQSSARTGIVPGLCAMLLGIAYEFSTRDSPVPRQTLHEILKSQVTRQKYRPALKQLLVHPFMRDFEITPQKADDSGELPNVYFDDTFVSFFKEKCRHITDVIDQDPSLEISVVVNGKERGISRDLVDTLRAEKEDAEHKLRQALDDATTYGQQLAQAQTDLARIKHVNESLQRHNEDESKLLSRKHEEAVNTLQRKHEEETKVLRRRLEDTERQHKESKQAVEDLRRKFDDIQQKHTSAVRSVEQKDQEMRTLKELSHQQLETQRFEAQRAAESSNAEAAAKAAEIQRQLDYIKKTSESEAARIQRRTGAELADLRATISRQEVDLMKAAKAHSLEIQAIKQESVAKDGKVTEAEQRIQQLQLELKEAKKAGEQIRQLEQKLNESETNTNDRIESVKAEKEDEIRKLKSQLDQKDAEVKKKDNEKAATQTELDDLLMVFGDLEEKVAKYKKQVQELGGTVSDAEDDDEDEDDDEEDSEVD